MLARLEKVNDDYRRNPAREDRLKNAAHGVDDGFHLPIGTRLPQENQKQQRHPTVNVRVGVKISDVVPIIQFIAQEEGEVFAEDDAEIIEQQKQNRRRKGA